MRAARVLIGAACVAFVVVLVPGPNGAPAQQSKALDTSQAGLLDAGQKVFIDQGCYGCHTIGKLGTQGVAPDLSHIGAKHDVAYLTKWLREPTVQRPTAHMPKIEMTKADADAVAAYLASLR
jgi:cytochrome c oxidase subunit 2